ncbi:MAG: type II secretion system F family protein [Alphaproteobacteria bacterium]
MRLSDYLPSGLTMESAILWAAGAAAFLVVAGVWQGLLERDPAAARLRQLSKRRETLMQDLKTPRRNQSRPRSVGFMHQVVERLKLLKNEQTQSVMEKLARAGWRSRDILVTYLFLKVTLPAVFGAVAATMFYGMGLYGLPAFQKLLVVLAAVLAGVYAPDIVVKNASDKRRNAIRLGLPDALDLMVICAEAGLSLDSALKRVAKEMALGNPEIADEFGLTSVEIGFLPDRVMALKNLIKRNNLPGIRGLVNTLIQSEKYGTPLAQSLRVLSAEYRNERLMRAEEKAARLPAILTVPMILFVLPPLFVVLIGPGILRFVDSMRGVTFPH